MPQFTSLSLLSEWVIRTAIFFWNWLSVGKHRDLYYCLNRFSLIFKWDILQKNSIHKELIILSRLQWSQTITHDYICVFVWLQKHTIKALRMSKLDGTSYICTTLEKTVVFRENYLQNAIWLQHWHSITQINAYLVESKEIVKSLQSTSIDDDKRPATIFRRF